MLAILGIVYIVGNGPSLMSSNPRVVSGRTAQARVMQPRSAKEIIDQAILENRVGERLLYCFAALFVLLGLSVLVWGAVQGDPVATISGAASGSLFWPAMTSARRTRRESVAIRLLEAPLARAETATEAAHMIKDLVRQILADSTPDGDG